MARIRVALVLFTLAAALLIPRPAAAQTLGCAVTEGLRVSSPAGYWGTRTVQVEGRTLTLWFCAPHAQSAAAEQMLDLAALALPVLAELTDVRLDDSLDRVFHLDTSGRLLQLNADGVIDPHNRILLHPNSLDSTVVHELAHYWADRERFRELWMVEAYAEYLTVRALPEVARRASFPVGAYHREEIPRACAQTPLSTWTRETDGAALCPYTAGVRVLLDLEELVGQETLRRVIGELALSPGGVESWALLQRLEQESGRSLALLMRGRVFGPALDGALVARAALHERYKTAEGRAAALGAGLPPALFEKLRNWHDDALAADLAGVEPLLTEAEVTSARCAELGLPCARPWAQALADPAAWPVLRDTLAATPQLFSVYEQLHAHADRLDLAVPEALRERAAALDGAAVPALLAADEALATALAVEGRCSDLGLPCRDLWRADWERGDLDALRGALVAIGGAFDAGVSLEGRCGALSERCRALWADAFAAGGPTGAQGTIGELDALLTAGASVERRCGGVGGTCGELWRAALRGGSPAEARALVTGLGGLLDRAEGLGAACGDTADACRALWEGALRRGALPAAELMVTDLEALASYAGEVEQQCATAGWGCGGAWRAALRADGPARARALLERQEAALPRLRDAEREVRDGGPTLSSALPGERAASGEPLAEARAAFARGDVAEAERLAEAVRGRTASERLALVGAVGLGVALVAGLLVVPAALVARRRRRPARSAAPGPPPPATTRQASRAAQAPRDLLADLLDAPPDERRP